MQFRPPKMGNGRRVLDVGSAMTSRNHELFKPENEPSPIESAAKRRIGSKVWR